MNANQVVMVTGASAGLGARLRMPSPKEALTSD